MTTLTKLEFNECLTVADAIMQHLLGTNWNFVPAPNLASGRLTSPRLASISVTLGAVPGTYRDVTLIRGNSGIRIDLPNQRFVPSQITAAEQADVRQVLFGVLIHECTHILQQVYRPTTFAASLTLERQFHAIASPTADDWFDLYIGQPFEQEARANQAAAEVLALAGSNLTQSQFVNELPNTEIWHRTELNIGARSSPAQKVRSWWAIWSAMAWDIYR